MPHKSQSNQQSFQMGTPQVKTNALYYGDNLIWLKNHNYFPSDSIDLIYLDPPFNSNADYNILFNEKTGEQSRAQWKAFDDTWGWEKEASHIAIVELSVKSPTVSEFILWLSRRGDSNSVSMAAYLSMMTIRLIELHRVLKPTGTLYLHCDPTASHYIKVIMDGIFGHSNFRNEIIWCYDRWISLSSDFQRNHDVIFRYSKTKDFTFNTIREIDEKRRKTLDRGYTTNLLHNGERQLIVYKGSEHKKNIQELIKKKKFARVLYREPEGNPLRDWWTINIIHPKAKERLGYPTQKPLPLLQRIITASSNEGDVVFDPFCGCGTAVVAAQQLNRKWIGVDVTYLAVNLIERRLANDFGGKIRNTYKVYGDPYDFASAQALFDRDSKDKHAFELWALKLVKAQARAKDGGVDGIIGFLDSENNLRRIVVQVKGGSNLSPSIIRDLIGTVQKENADMGLLVSLHTPTKGMYQDANHAGDYKGKERLYKKIQIRTITELIEEDKLFDLPYENPVTIQKEQGKQELLF